MLMLIVGGNLYTKLEHYYIPTEKNLIFPIEYQSKTQHNKNIYGLRIFWSHYNLGKYIFSMKFFCIFKQYNKFIKYRCALVSKILAKYHFSTLNNRREKHISHVQHIWCFPALQRDLQFKWVVELLSRNLTKIQIFKI